MNEPDDLFDDYIEDENGLEKISLESMDQDEGLENIELVSLDGDGDEVQEELVDESLVLKMSARRRIEQFQDEQRLQQELEYY